METIESNTLRVIVCRPGEVAEIVTIEDKLEAMQAIVGGLIQHWERSSRSTLRSR